ncbi:MAG: flagellar filament capping protein FliD [Acidobacteriota bacterium]
MASPLSFFGGLDIETIVRALIDADRGPITRATNEIDEFQGQLSALSEISSAVSSLGSTATSELTRDKLAALTATSSDEELVTASGDGAELGQHSVVVEQLARAARFQSDEVADRNVTQIAHGDLTFTADGTTTTVTVDDDNDTLQGLADSINAADGNARASIVNNGTGDILVLTSEKTGLSEAVSIDSNTTGLSFTQNQTALDAIVHVDGIKVTSGSNAVTGALEGVTLNLHAADATKTVTVEFGIDSDGAAEAIESFVGAYNNALAVIERHAQVDTSGSGNSGPFAGDSAIRALKQDLLNTAISRVTPNDANAYALLSDVGVTLTESGRLSLNRSDLDDALEGDPEKVANLFVTRGFGDSSDLGYVASSNATVSGTYAVEITQVAEQATIQGNRSIGAGLAQNETLTIIVGDDLVDVDLLAGDDGDAVVSRINGALSSNGIQARATLESDKLRLNTLAYGSSASIKAYSSVGDVAGSVGISTTPVSDEGQDVGGTIDGVAAVGAGQILTGADDTNVEGLKISVASTSTGSLGDFTFRRGLGDLIDRAADRATDGIVGRLPPKKKNLEAAISRREDRIDRLEQILEERADALRRRFSAAQSALQSLQAMQASLGGLS